MNRRTIDRDDRGASVALNYTLSLVIVTLLISGLFMGMNDFLQTERERAVDAEFGVLGNRIAADIAATDRLAQTATGPDSSVTVTTGIPPEVAGTGYTITIVSTGVDNDAGGGDDYYDVTIYMETQRLSVNESVQVRTHYRVVNTQIPGGDYVITFDGSTLEVSGS